MSKRTQAEVTIDLSDVLAHGSVSAAIAETVEDSLLVADPRAMGGQTFATSGPGSGWTKTFDAGDYARAAICQDVQMSDCDPSESRAIDPEDGRMARGVDPEDGEEWDGEIEWSDESVVRVEVPDLDEAMEHPEEVAAMAQSVIDYHGPQSDRAAWRTLIEEIRKAAEAFEDIAIDALDD